MPTTTPKGIPIPEETDPLGATDERIIELADFLDTDLYSPRLLNSADTVELLQLVFTPMAGPQLTLSDTATESYDIRCGLAGPFVQLFVGCFFDGAASAAAGTSGNMTNVLGNFRIGNPAMRPIVMTPGSSGPTGRMAAFTLTNGGLFYLTAVPGTPDVSAGEQFTTTFCYMRRN